MRRIIEKRHRRWIGFLLTALLLLTNALMTPVPSEAKGFLAEGDGVKTIFIYGNDKNGEQMLLAQLSVSEMLAYLNAHMDTMGRVHNYSVIDRFPTTVHQEAQGFTVQGLLDYAVSHSAVEGLSLTFDSQDTIAFWEIDGADYDEADTYSWEDFYGIERYNFPALYEHYDQNTHQYDDMAAIWDAREKEEVILSITAYSQRYFLTDAFEEGSSDLENTFDHQGLLDTAKTMRLMLPMTQDDFVNTRSTAANSRWGICNVLLDLESMNAVQAVGYVEKPVCTVIDGDASTDATHKAGYSYFTLSCPTEGAAIYYNDCSVSSYVPTAEYTPRQEIEVKKNNGTAALRVRAVKDGCTDAGIVTLDDQQGGADETIPEGTDTWDGSSVDTSWYVGHEEDPVYTITTCSQLAGLAELINDGVDSEWTEQGIDGKDVMVLSDKQQNVSFQGKTVLLGADLNLAGKEFEVIGDLKGVWQVSSRGYRDLYLDKIYAFDGTFDGGGHTIYGLNPVSLDGSAAAGRRGSCGLFGCVENAVVKDLTLKGRVSGSVENGIGAFAGKAVDSQFIRCRNDAKITVNAAAPEPTMGERGGIVGNAQGCHFISCVNYGEIGLNGRGIGDGTLENCNNYGSVNGVGIGSGTVTDCMNYGTVTQCGIGAGTITRCANHGSVTGDGSADNNHAASGTVSGIGSGEITDCLNTGTVAGAGIGSGTLRRCVNVGDTVWGLLYSGSVYDSCHCGTASAADIACGKNTEVLISNCYTSTKGNVLEGFVSKKVTVGKAVYYPQGGTEVASAPTLDVYKVNARTETVMKGSGFVTTLNQAAGASVFRQDTTGLHGGYPLLSLETGVVFDSAGGSAVSPQLVLAGETVSEPDAPVLEGATFAGWYTDVGCENPYDFSMPVEEPVILYAGWTTAGEASPSFQTHSLLLSGQIGVNYYMDLPKSESVDYAGSYMEFTVNGQTTRADFDPGKKNQDGSFYGFTCYINSAQMADAITAVFHYGENLTVEDAEPYSVSKYVDAFHEAADSFDEKTRTLVDALADYGHYIQPFLAETRGWKIGEAHQEMPGVNSYTDEDVQKAADAVENFGILRETGESGIEKVTFSLYLDTDTSMYFYLKPKADFSGEVTAQIGGAGENAAEKLSDGRYRVVVPGISAHLLGTDYRVDVSADSAFTIQASAMSYVNAMLHATAYQDNQAAQYAMTALYNYYQAAAAYTNR